MGQLSALLHLKQVSTAFAMGTPVGSGFLGERVRKMERVPPQEHPYDIQRFVEACQLLEDVLDLLPEQVCLHVNNTVLFLLPAIAGAWELCGCLQGTKGLLEIRIFGATHMYVVCRKAQEGPGRQQRPSTPL